MRPLLLVAMLGAPACFVYEVGFGERDRDDDDIEDTDTPDGVDEDLFLSVSQADPGDEFVTTLESRGSRSFDGYSTLRFERDVTVLDEVPRGDDVLLLLGVAADAAPGVVSVVAVGRGGSQRTLATGFEILGSTSKTTPGTTGSTATTGDSGTPTSTTDTADTKRTTP